MQIWVNGCEQFCHQPVKIELDEPRKVYYNAMAVDHKDSFMGEPEMNGFSQNQGGYYDEDSKDKSGNFRVPVACHYYIGLWPIRRASGNSDRATRPGDCHQDPQAHFDAQAIADP
jgi:hypothetical protein